MQQFALGMAMAALAPAMAAATDTLSLTGANTGKPMVLHRGQSVGIELQTNPSTGYSWKVDADRGLKVIVTDTVNTRPGVPGAPSVVTYRVVAAKRGTYRLTFRYMRPWEGKAVRTLAYILRVV